MRTTINLEPDIEAEVRRLNREHGLGVSEALNQLARAGMTARPERHVFRQRAVPMGLRIDVSNIAEALEQLDGPGAR